MVRPVVLLAREELTEDEARSVAKADIRKLRKVVSWSVGLSFGILHVKVVLQNVVHHCWIILCTVKGIDVVCRNSFSKEVLSFVFKRSLKLRDLDNSD